MSGDTASAPFGAAPGIRRSRIHAGGRRASSRSSRSARTRSGNSIASIASANAISARSLKAATSPSSAGRPDRRASTPSRTGSVAAITASTGSRSAVNPYAAGPPGESTSSKYPKTSYTPAASPTPPTPIGRSHSDARRARRPLGPITASTSRSSTIRMVSGPRGSRTRHTHARRDLKPSRPVTTSAGRRTLPNASRRGGASPASCAGATGTAAARPATRPITTHRLVLCRHPRIMRPRSFALRRSSQSTDDPGTRMLTQSTPACRGARLGAQKGRDPEAPAAFSPPPARRRAPSSRDADRTGRPSPPGRSAARAPGGCPCTPWGSRRSPRSAA